MARRIGNPTGFWDAVTVQALTAASLTTSLTGTNNDLVYTADTAGTAGNSITIEYLDPATINASLSVDVTGTAIVINLATDGTGAITTTGDDIKTAIINEAPAAALVDVADAGGNDGSGVVTALAATNLAGGLDESRTSSAVEIPRFAENLALYLNASAATTLTLQVAHSGTPTSEGIAADANAGNWMPVYLVGDALAVTFSGAGTRCVLIPDFVPGWIRLVSSNGNVLITAGWEIISD